MAKVTPAPHHATAHGHATHQKPAKKVRSGKHRTHVSAHHRTGKHRTHKGV